MRPSRSVDRPRASVPGPAHEENGLDSALARHLPGLRDFLSARTGSLLRSQESASDLVQSVCREILQDRASFEYRGDAAFRSWLFEAARRKIVDRHRYYTRAKRDVGALTLLPEADGPALASPRHAPEEEASLRERVLAVEAALDELPADYRRVILLVHVAGRSHREVAAALGRTPAATRNLLPRALARLARVLRRDGTASSDVSRRPRPSGPDELG